MQYLTTESIQIAQYLIRNKSYNYCTLGIVVVNFTFVWILNTPSIHKSPNIQSQILHLFETHNTPYTTYKSHEQHESQQKREIADWKAK